MEHVQATITSTYAESDDYRIITLNCPDVARTVQPGQFVHVRVSGTLDPFLRRPISVMLADRQLGQIRLLVRRVGRGTDLLAAMATGAQVDLMGPLGNGMAMPEAKQGMDVVLVAGGVGVAPLVFLADALQTHPANFRVCALLGGASDRHLPAWTELAGRSEEFYVTTEDGSAGETGLVTDLLPEQLYRGDSQVVYTCGPRPMMAVVAQLCAEASIPCYASLEQWMGCGVGACLGCVVPATAGGYLRVCTDGPVFAAQDIDWAALQAGPTPPAAAKE